MHKNIPVVDMEILSDTGRIVRLFNLQAPEHLPLGVNTKEGMSRKAMDDWWTGRSIPASRDGIREALEHLNVYNTAMLLDKCYGLSLSDQYWICPKNSGLQWGKINFFHNDFSKDMGEILFGYEPDDLNRISLVSPDNTSDGWLRKKWIIAGGKRFLMKGGSGVFRQEPFNEVIASAIMLRLNINHVTYTLTFDKGKPYSLCETFVTPDTDLVPAWRIRATMKKDNRDSNLAHLLRCCENLGISGTRTALDQMLVLDYIISNEDRHYHHLGFIRNAEPLEWLGFAPVYDSGTSLWYNTQRVGSAVESKPFRSSHAEQIKLVQDLSWFDAGLLKGLDDEIIEILSVSEEVDQARSGRIAKAVMERAGQIERLQMERKPSALAMMKDNKRIVDKTLRKKRSTKTEPDL
jgi:hypothetical protein